MPALPQDHRGRTIDFGRTAADYDAYRPGFPDSMFERLAGLGWVAPNTTALDLGTGTGSLALGLAQRGIEVTGLDPSPELLEVARRRAAEAQLVIRFVQGTAEDTQQPPGTFDLVTAGQCWWWFDGPRAVTEVRRVLRPGGRLLIANFAYLATPGSVAARTEDLILAHNPGWPKAGDVGIWPEQLADLDRAGFDAIESFSYVETLHFTHEAWRGRIRACNGVGAALASAEVEAFDRALAKRLAQEFPGQLRVPHRVSVVTGVAG